MEGFEMWAYRGLIAILLIVGWYFFKRTLKQILDQLREMNTSMKTISEKAIVHDCQLAEVRDAVKDHEGRIRDVEKKQDQCSFCGE